MRTLDFDIHRPFFQIIYHEALDSASLAYVLHFNDQEGVVHGIVSRREVRG